ncbi:MAG: aldo/keto reductase [Promethearchaeia archaeon]
MDLNIQSTIKLNNDIEMPILGLGTWQNKGKSVIRSVKWALEFGYRHIDTASFYKNESQIGKALQESDIPRKDIFITSKVWDTEQGYKSTLKAFELSTRKLKTDYLDLYLIHWPRKQRKATWKALQELYNEGKVKAIGVANFSIHHIEDLINDFSIIPAVNQFELSPFFYRKDLINFCRENKIAVEAYSPLTHGKKLDHPLLEDIAKKYEKSSAQILIRWGVQHKFIEIPKSSSKSHIRENAEVFDFRIQKEEMQKLDNIEENFQLLDDTKNWD